MTLAVSPFGEGEKWNSFVYKSIVYILSASLSGALFGLFIVATIQYLISWVPTSIKLSVILLLLVSYILKELKFINLPTPQMKWQIPTSWVNNSPLKNMVIWGVILGSGFFTYNPYAIFFILYLYMGFFMTPIVGLSIGFLYGLSRSLVSFFIAASCYNDTDKHSEIINKIWSQGRLFGKLNLAALIGLVLYVAYLLLL
ncbi:hypothetical protein J2S74_004248 [Evansella vedderi]|uniref:Urease accessory protein UreH-like transmembrane domain-containing protein n=1 Tax=Evansella vedderi TaxID=38282 RepID=A0ABU0A1G8_9BACI|nr:hypothetical protein [Evansella vedderi]MDQ0256826.1 hypothetical protein [Evansella vedderi]